MQRKVTAVLGFGFLLGMGLASCASQQNSRAVSSDSSPHYVAEKDEKEKKASQCLTGEEKNDLGECVRLHTFDRPFRRGGR